MKNPDSIQHFSFGIRTIFLFMLAAAMLACQDDEREPEPEKFFIRGCFGNVMIEFNEQGSLGAIVSQSGVQFSASLYGNNEEITGATIQIFDTEPIAPGSYSGFVQHDSHMEGVLLSFSDEDGNYITDTQNPVANVTISLLTTEDIRGSFSGTVVNVLSGEPLLISQGEFFLKRME